MSADDGDAASRGADDRGESPEERRDADERLERATGELTRRLEQAEALARRAEARADSAEEKAASSLRAENAFRSELAGLREEISQLTRSLTRPREMSVAATPDAADDGAFTQLANEVAARVDKVEGRVSAASQAVRELATQREPVEPQEVSEPRADRPDVNAADRPDVNAADRPDVNEVRFEQLRELGLSVTQAARLLAVRDARGKLRSLDEIGEHLDFPRELAERLKRALRVGG